LDASEVRTGL